MDLQSMARVDALRVYYYLFNAIEAQAFLEERTSSSRASKAENEYDITFMNALASLVVPNIK